jgi:hypothetical protein
MSAKDAKAYHPDAQARAWLSDILLRGSERAKARGITDPRLTACVVLSYVAANSDLSEADILDFIRGIM